jgi:hypothetical protein
LNWWPPRFILSFHIKTHIKNVTFSKILTNIQTQVVRLHAISKYSILQEINFYSRVRRGRGFEFTTLVVIVTHCTGSCKSNYHTITTTTDPTVKINFLQYGIFGYRM